MCVKHYTTTFCLSQNRDSSGNEVASYGIDDRVSVPGKGKYLFSLPVLQAHKIFCEMTTKDSLSGGKTAGVFKLIS